MGLLRTDVGDSQANLELCSSVCRSIGNKADAVTRLLGLLREFITDPGSIAGKRLGEFRVKILSRFPRIDRNLYFRSGDSLTSFYSRVSDTSHFGSFHHAQCQMCVRA